MDYSRKILDKAVVEVDKTKESLDFTSGLWNRLLTNFRNLDWVHLNFFFRNDQPKIFYPLLLKITFLWAEEEFVISQNL